MRIALDLTSIPSRKAGVAYYLVGLVAALQRVDHENEYLLLLNASSADSFPAPSARFTRLVMPDRPRPARLLWEQVALPSWVVRHHVDVLHSPHYTRPLRRLSCASVVGVMDLTYLIMPEHHSWSRRLFFRRMLPAAARLADRVIAISESTKRDLQQMLGIPAGRIDVIPLAAADVYRRPAEAEHIERVRERLSLPGTYVLFVGTIEPRKNLARLLRAFAQVVQTDPEFPDLVLVGMRGWGTSAFQATLQETGISGRVHIAGYVAEEDLPAIYAAATLFVYPSLYEGFGIPVLEALESGVPTITSTTSSMPEVAGDAALLVDPYDVDALAGAMVRLFRDAELRAFLHQKGPERAAMFDWDTTARLTAKSYRRAFLDRSAAQSWRKRLPS